MLGVVLGAAAGGGFPQWNSNAPACRRPRGGDVDTVAVLLTLRERHRFANHATARVLALTIPVPSFLPTPPSAPKSKGTGRKSAGTA